MMLTSICNGFSYFFTYFFSNSYVIITPTVATAARPMSLPIPNPATPGINKLPNQDPESTYIA
jgi:hypothetical protein